MKLPGEAVELDNTSLMIITPGVGPLSVEPGVPFTTSLARHPAALLKSAGACDGFNAVSEYPPPSVMGYQPSL